MPRAPSRLVGEIDAQDKQRLDAVLLELDIQARTEMDGMSGFLNG